MERRDFLRQSGLTLTGLLLSPWAVYAFPSREGEVLIPFVDQPPEPPSKRGLLDWNELDSFITPNDNSSTSHTMARPKLILRRGGLR